MYVASVRDRLRSALQEAQAQSTKKHTDRNSIQQKKGAVNLKPSDLILVKAECLEGKEEDQG